MNFHGLEVVYELTDEQIDHLVKMYHREWWTRGREREDVAEMLKNSDLVMGMVDKESPDRLAGFARVLTDRVYKALILDVIVERSARGKGIGRHMMNLLLSHPMLRDVRHFELYCLPDLIPFYEKWGFKTDLGGLEFMRYDRQSGF